MPILKIKISKEVYSLLEVLTKGKYAPDSVEGVVAVLIDHAQQGVYRPGAWEREWLKSVFFDFEQFLEPGDPYGREGCEQIFQRPKGVSIA